MQGASIVIVEDIDYPPVRETSMTNSFEDGKLFLDNDFPPSESTLYHSNKRQRDPQIVWLRPHELIIRPELLVDGVSRHDIVQGILADCWFLSSCSAVAQRPDLMEKVIPSNQPLSGEGYKGIVTFRFWRFGHWVTVYVDDLLPTKKKKLIYSRSSEPREFWVSLLEKAYAKLHGSYEALEGGQAMDALVDLTGGLAEMYVLESAPPHLYNFLLQASTNGAFITCSRKGDWKESGKADSNGLVSGHAYTISAVATVKLSTGSDAYLVRIRNPWGNDTEWNGKWNDRGQKMYNRRHCSADVSHSRIIDCNLCEAAAKINKGNDSKCNIVIALMQLRRRCVRHPRRKMLQIAFVLFKVTEPVRQTLQNFLHIEEIGNSGPYVNYREVFGRFQMSPGHYIIVPATFEPDSPGSFFIRAYSDTPITLREL
ncbi:Calpain-2 catalytic subunit like protein [Argiope bruennichi]|uniref:Calpain-2 catalytic subunit like protein n=1 Tax=Argiope bruennichi TaxID=94029 RepID=A0A8T0F6M2_ARGBR|nr:Calpain-2 catalytic subunit like protein [Argiope bruennichi]